jgi:hypothetical protein
MASGHLGLDGQVELAETATLSPTRGAVEVTVIGSTVSLAERLGAYLGGNRIGAPGGAPWHPSLVSPRQQGAKQ